MVGKCGALCKNGNACKNNAKFKGFCGVHVKSVGECMICYTEKPLVKMKRCVHSLCKECNDAWLPINNICPMCREPQCRYTAVFNTDATVNMLIGLYTRVGPSGEEWAAFFDTLNEHKVGLERFMKWFEESKQRSFENDYFGEV